MGFCCFVLLLASSDDLLPQEAVDSNCFSQHQRVEMTAHCVPRWSILGVSEFGQLKDVRIQQTVNGHRESMRSMHGSSSDEDVTEHRAQTSEPKGFYKLAI